MAILWPHPRSGTSETFYFSLWAPSSQPSQVCFCKSTVNYSLEHHYELCAGKLFSLLLIMNFTKGQHRAKSHMERTGRQGVARSRHLFLCLFQIIPLIIASDPLLKTRGKGGAGRVGRQLLSVPGAYLVRLELILVLQVPDLLREEDALARSA